MTKAASSLDSRTKSRIRILIPVNLTVDGKTFRGELGNLSEGGAQIRGSFPVNSGSALKIEFLLSVLVTPGGAPLDVHLLAENAPPRFEVLASVRWVKDEAIGIQFEKLKRAHRKLIDELTDALRGLSP